MNLEQIVRALAATDPAGWIEGGESCGLCGASAEIADLDDNPDYDPWSLNRPANHNPGCPWGLAREWVGQHPA